MAPHHHAAYGAVTTDQGAAGGAARRVCGGIESDRECKTPVVARQRGRGAGPHRQPVYRFGPDPQTIRPGGQVGGGDRGLADLHPEQPGIDPELRRTVPAGGDDQDGVCGVDDQSGGEPAVCEEAADAVDAERSALAVTTRTKVLNNELEDVFRRWFPRFRPKAQTTSPEQKAA